MGTAAIEFVTQNAIRYFADRPKMRPSQWCVENLWFDEDDNHGPFNFSGSEYCRELVDDFGDSKVSDSVAVFGSQSRKTGSFMGGAAWAMVNDPCGVFWVMPNQSLARTFTRKRWIPMLKKSMGTRNLIPRGADRYDFTTTDQRLGPSSIIFTGSKSAANLASTPRRRVILDEIDKFDEGGNREADAVNLAEQRTKDQPGAQRFKSSTPTLISGLIWQEAQKGDLRRYFVPAPCCGRHHPSSRLIVLAWSPQYTTFKKTGQEAWAVWDKEAKRKDGTWNIDRVVRSARYRCPHCGADILDAHKTWMNRNGEWIATKSGSPGFISRHLPSLYACGPNTSVGQLAKKFLEQKHSLLGVQGFINGDLAEPYQGQDRSAERIELITTAAKIDVGAQWVTVQTVDCQAKAPYFWFVKRAFSERESIAIAAGSSDSWEEVRMAQGSAHGWINSGELMVYQNELDQSMVELAKKFPVKDQCVLVDSGFGARSDADVYVHCAEYSAPTDSGHGKPFMLGWMSAKGFPKYKRWKDPESNLLLPYFVRDIDPYEGTDKANIVTSGLFEFSGEYFKEILEKLRADKEGKLGHKWSVFDEVATEEYWRHLDGKQKVGIVDKGSRKTVFRWQTRPHWPDHLDDCEIMCIAFAAFLGLLKIPDQQQ